LMYISLAYIFLHPLKIFVTPIGAAISLITTFIEDSAEVLSSFRGIMISLNYWFTPLFLVPVFILIALSFLGDKRLLKRIMLINFSLLAMFLVTVGAYHLSDNRNVYAEYVTQTVNDGVLVKSNGKLFICEVSTGSYTFASYLASHRLDLNCTEIEAYMLTHYHSRHINALDRLTDNFMVRSIILPTPITDNDMSVFESICAMAEEKNIRMVCIDRQHGDTLTFCRTEIETYPYTILSRSTHPVIAVRFSSDEETLMYLGGSFNEGDESVMNHAREADYLIFGGHSPIYKKAFDAAELHKSVKNGQ